MGHKKYENPQRRTPGFVKGVQPQGRVVRRRKDVFADIGANKSIGDVGKPVHAKDRPEFDIFPIGSNKKSILSMQAAIQGMTPSPGAGDNVTWTPLTKREVIGKRTFSQPDQVFGGLKRFTQTRFRSGSIIEDHEHQAKGSSSWEQGSILHMDRNKRTQYTNKSRRQGITDPLPTKTK